MLLLLLLLSIVFKFSLDGCNTQEKWKTKVMQNLGAEISWIMEKVEVAYEYFFSCKSTNQNQDLKITRKSFKPVK